MTFTAAELTYLREQPIGRLCTIGPDLGPEDATIDIVGHALASTQKWHNVLRNPRVAFIVDTVCSVRPPDTCTSTTTCCRPLLERGVAEEQITTMLVDNPRRIFDRQGGY